MQLTAAAVTPPAEHAARRPAGAADAAAADADVRQTGSIGGEIDLMRALNCIARGFALLISLLLLSADCHAEKAEILVVDTLYARVAVGISNERPCSGLCAICDVIAKYRVPLYASRLGGMTMSVLESGSTCSYNVNYLGYYPPDKQYQDSVRCAFPLKAGEFEEAHVRIRIGGPYYGVTCESDTMRHEHIGNISYWDTLVVRTQRIK
jgi:hypothetical protein